MSLPASFAAEQSSSAVLIPPALSATPELPPIAPPVDVHQMLQSVAHQLRRQFAAKKLEVEMKLTARGYLVPGDAQRMRQVYMNLLSNAITYARRGGQIIIRSSCPTPDALRVEVSHL